MKILIVVLILISLLFVIFVIYMLYNLIYFEYNKRINYKNLKNYITTANKKVKDIKHQFDILPCGLLNSYNEAVCDNITKDLVTNEVYIKLQNVYKSLIEYKKIVNSINSSILSISKSKSDIINYIQNNYPYCEQCIKDELNKFLTEINVDNSIDFNKARMYRLINEQRILDNKLTKFLNKIVKINSIISDDKNIGTKILELNKLNLVWDNNKKIIEYAKVGNRYTSLIKPDFDYYVNNMKSNLKSSIQYLNDGDFNNSLLCYGNYATSVSLLTRSYDMISKLMKDYNNSDKYIKSNRKNINNLTTKIEDNIFKLGVKNSNRVLYDGYRNDILVYNKLLKVDIISASEKHKDVIKNLEELSNNIETDIKSYYKK